MMLHSVVVGGWAPLLGAGYDRWSSRRGSLEFSVETGIVVAVVDGAAPAPTRAIPFVPFHVPIRNEPKGVVVEPNRKTGRTLV